MPSSASTSQVCPLDADDWDTTQAVLDTVDLLRGTPVDASMGRSVASAVSPPAARSAGRYLWIGLWSLAVPAALGAITAILQARN